MLFGDKHGFDGRTQLQLEDGKQFGEETNQFVRRREAIVERVKHYTLRKGRGLEFEYVRR